jgi:ubiquinone/menaquinone biosynthesis C-methylase UbiE
MNLEKQPFSRKNSKDRIINDWVLDTTQAMRKPGGRDLADYKEFLNFDEKELNGKTVLDLGSGSQEKLTRNLKEAGVEAEVVSLNPDYILPKYRNIINNQEDWQKKSVAAVAQSLPFKDESFDVILGLESVAMYEDAFKKPLSAQAWSKEIARVLKPGGEARLAELLGMGAEKRQEAWQKIIELLKKLGLEAKIEVFQIKEKYPLPRYRIIIKKPQLPLEGN